MFFQSLRLLLALTVLSFLAGCADDDVFIKDSDCEPMGDIRVYCPMQTPEDIAALSDGRHLLLAHFGGMGEGTGTLSLFDTETETLSQLFPLPGMTMVNHSERWGDPSCPAPDIKLLSPHGTHLHELDSGQLRYLVVNHGGRESVEFFEVTGEGATTLLTWRGCVLPTNNTVINDVVGLANGDVVYTRMFEQVGDLAMLKSLAGLDTGDLWYWSRDEGLRVLPGTRANQPNGIEISARMVLYSLLEGIGTIVIVIELKDSFLGA